MTVFTTCRGCKHAFGCETPASIRTAIKGLGITTLKHRCTIREPEFLPGDPVTVRTGTEGEGEYGPVWYQAGFDGVFIREMKGNTQVVCFIKPGTEGDTGDEFEPKEGKRGFVKLPRSRVKKRDGDCVKLKECERCGGLPQLTGECDFLGDKLYLPEGCVIKKERQAA